MNEYRATVLVSGFDFPEAPQWHAGQLWFSDMWGYKVYRLDQRGEVKVVCKVPGRPSGLGFLPDGTLLVVSMTDRIIYRVRNGTLSRHSDLSEIARGDLNDLLVDEAGRAYVGNFGFDVFAGAMPTTADLALVSVEGTARVIAKDLNFPNGAVLVDGGKTLVIAETLGNRLTAFDRSSDGSLSRRRVYAALDERTPDGICADQAGGIWVSSFATGEFVRVLPGGGISDRITCEGKRAISCTLGGADRRTLYCATFAGTLEEIGKSTGAGAIETVSVEHPGAQPIA